MGNTNQNFIEALMKDRDEFALKFADFIANEVFSITTDKRGALWWRKEKSTLTTEELLKIFKDNQSKTP